MLFFFFNPVSARVNIGMVYEKGTFKLVHISCLVACAMAEHMSAHLCWLLTVPLSGISLDTYQSSVLPSLF